eukprot:2370351-Prymnesium_polylepis.1
MRRHRHRQHFGGSRPHLHTAEWAMESCGARRESFFRCGVTTPLTTTPPAPSIAVHYSQASIEI